MRRETNMNTRDRRAFLSRPDAQQSKDNTQASLLFSSSHHDYQSHYKLTLESHGFVVYNDERRQQRARWKSFPPRKLLVGVYDCRPRKALTCVSFRDDQPSKSSWQRQPFYSCSPFEEHEIDVPLMPNESPSRGDRDSPFPCRCTSNRSTCR